MRIPRVTLFSSPEGKQFPGKIAILADIKRCNAHVDITIGTDGQPEAVTLTTENYLTLETKASIHILVVDKSRSQPQSTALARQREDAEA